MHSDLNKFYRQTVTYTLGNLIYRGAAFLLVPLYAHKLTPAEYGSLELIMVTSFLIQAVFSSAVAHAAQRFYFEYDNEADRRTVISTALIGSFVFAGTGAALLLPAAPLLSRLVFGGAGYALAFRLVLVSMVFEISREISLAYVRARQEATFFLLISIVQLVAQVAANVYTVVRLELGITGILAGNLAATFTIWTVLTAFSVKHCGLRFEWARMWPIVKYGNPMMWSSLSSSLAQNADRYVLNAFVNLRALGMYALGMRIANMLPVLAIVPFTNGYGPFRFSVMKQENAPAIYARVLTYFVFAAAFLGMGISVASREAVRLVASPEYGAAWKVIPPLVAAFLVGGVNYCLQTGIYIRKQTRHVFYISLGTAMADVALILLLIPLFGALGAALAALGAALYTVAHTYVVSQRLYPVRYETARLLKISLAAVLLGAVGCAFEFGNLWYSLAAKAGVALLFPVLVGVLGGYDPEEIRRLRALCSAVRMRVQFRPAES